MKYIIITTYGQRIIEAEDFEVAAQEAYGDSYIDHDRLNNQHKLQELAEHLIADLCRNASYANRYEYSMKEIGEEARKFLGFLVEEYGLMNYVEREEECLGE